RLNNNTHIMAKYLAQCGIPSQCGGATGAYRAPRPPAMLTRNTVLCDHIRSPLVLWLPLQPGTISKSTLRKQKATRKHTPVGKKNALLVYPEFATSFWSFKFALQYLGKKSSMPSLGLLTLANMFSTDYNLRLVDMNVRPLTDADLYWADLVCTSTMV